MIEMGYEVLIISRQSNHIQWHQNFKIIEALENSDLLINLAGKSVDCRYTSENKALILASRIDTTKLLCEAILNSLNPPKLFINSGTATIYRHAEDRPMTEEKGELGIGFSVDVAQQWENTFLSYQFSKTRQVVLRIAIVLGKGRGALQPLSQLVKLGFGGSQGSGKQMFSWIHMEDLLKIILFLLKTKSTEGVYNCSSPHPVSNQQLMQTLRNVLNRKFGIPLPKWTLEIGARIIKTETELILKSRWVLPERLLQLGFEFKYPSLEMALRSIYG